MSRLVLAGVCALVIVIAVAKLAGPAPGHPPPRLAAAVPRPAVSLPTRSPPVPIPLSSGWRYRPDQHDAGLSDGWGLGAAPSTGWRAVSLPNDFNSQVSTAGDRGQVGWYATTFTGPAIIPGRTWKVAFEGVRRHARVWLNGRPIGSSVNPYTPFTLAASGLLSGRPNRLIVRVDNFKRGSLPEDWWNWGGITGPVSLVPAGRLALQELGVLPELGCRMRCGDWHIVGDLTNVSPARQRPVLMISSASPSAVTRTWWRKLPALGAGRSVAIDLRLPLPRPIALWSPGHPALYQVHVRALAGERIEQEQKLSVGLRSVQVSHGILYLNGRRLWLHGAAIQEDVAGRGAALTDGDINTIVFELRSLGANVTRAHYELSPRLLDALDAAGILVWAQPPVDHADAELAGRPGRLQALSLLRSTLLTDRNHPSVIVDSVGNELTPTPDTSPGTRAYLRAAIPLARELDPQVPVALDTYCYPGFPAQRIYSQLGILGIASYFGWYPGRPGHSIARFGGLAPFLARSHRRYPRQAIVVSEFGAEATYDGSPEVKGTYEFQSDYLRRTWAVLDRTPYLNGAIYWTLREFAVAPGWSGGQPQPPGASADGIHHKGLIAYDGEAKPAFAVAQQLFATSVPVAR
ncbi:MAG: glycoside hydrolase family 2 protein [Solirubrobacteraceae bacterium]